MDKMDLLKQALDLSKNKRKASVPTEDLRAATIVALAYLDGRVSGQSLNTVLNRGGNANVVAESILSQAYQRGIIRIEMTEDNERGD